MGEDNGVFPVVTFVTDRGRTIEFTSNTSGGRIGESVTVRYDPDDPTDARIAGFSCMFVPAIFIVVGGILTFFGIRRLYDFPGTPEPSASRND